jgi:hypothetical protein
MHDSGTLALLALVTFIAGLLYAVWQLILVKRAQASGERSALGKRAVDVPVRNAAPDLSDSLRIKVPI